MRVLINRMKRMRTTRLLTALTLAVLVTVACGTRDSELTGGGAASFNAVGQNTNDNLSPELGAALPGFREVRVISDVDSIRTGSADVANIAAFIADENNRPYADAEVSFSANGGLLQNIVAASDINGEASATVQLANDFRNQEITVEVSSNGSIGTAVIQAIGTELDISGALNLSVGSDASLSARLTSGLEEPIPNQQVIVTSEGGNAIEMESDITSISGVVEFTVKDLSQSDVITVSALGDTVTKTAPISVVTELLSINGFSDGSEVSVGSITDVVVSYTSSGQPIAGETIRASLTAGQLLTASEVRTNAAGEARFTMTSSSAGPSTLIFNTLDGSLETSINVEYVATVPAVLSLNSTPSRVSSLGTATITAVVTDSNGNAVKNQEISFASSNLFGGQLNPASATTNSEGEAVVTFTAGSSATQIDELNISAQIAGTSVANTTQLTVVERVLNVTIGTSNKIEERAVGTQFGLPFVVQVADGGGAPLVGATVTVSARPLTYRKGFMRIVNSDGLTLQQAPVDFDEDRWEIFYVTCDAEDANGNRILDPGEDSNNNGVLDPQDPSLLTPLGDGSEFATLVGDTLVTNELGTGLLEMLYPTSSAFWAQVEITARAQALGAESEARFTTSLPMLADRLDDTSAPPANVVSPYGTDFDCSNDN